MGNLDRRSGVIPFGEAQKRIPSAESDHAVTLLERGTVKIKLSLFENCSGDLAVWVVFYGVRGGEVAA